MTDKMKDMAIARGHLEMVITWSIQAVFSPDCVKEICYPNVKDLAAAKSAYNTVATDLIKRLHNQSRVVRGGK